MEYLGTIYKGSQSDIIFPVPFIELSDGATVDFYTDGDGGFSRTKDEIKIDNYMLKTTASADELNSLNDGVLNYTINTCMGKSEGDTGLYLSKPSSYVDKQYLTADGVKTINGESIVGQGNIEIQGGGGEDYIWEWNRSIDNTGTTSFTEKELLSVIDAHNNGKNIIIKDSNYNYIYPSLVSVHKETILSISYMYRSDTYIFTYSQGLQTQILSKKEASEIYEWGWWRSDMMSLTGGTTKFTIEVINKIKQAILKRKIIVINYINQYRWPVYTSYIGNHMISLEFGQANLINYEWKCQLSSDEQSITSQAVRRTLQQEQLKSTSVITINNINLANNKDVDNILTNLKSSNTITNNNINELSGNVETVQAKDIEQDKRIDTIESYAKESLGNLEELSGSVVNNYYTKTQCDKQYEVIGYSYSKKEVDGKIPTSTSQLTNDSGYLTEHQSLEEYYTKGETYSKSEIDTKIGDINNILETI